MSGSTTSRIVLFDMKTTGHHVQHMRLLSTYLVNQGNEVTLITSSLGSQLDQFPVENSNFHLKILKNSKPDNKKLLFELINTIYGLYICVRYSNNWNADILHILSVDRLELALGITHLFCETSSSTDVFATLVAPYYKTENPILSPSHLFHSINAYILKKFLEKNYLSGIFVLSEYTREELLEKWPSIPPNSIVAVPDPIVPFQNNKTKQEARETLSLPSERLIILFFGQLRYAKGPDILLDATSFFPENLTVVFAGPPGHVGQNEIDQQRENLTETQIEARLEFISENLIGDYFSSADVVVLPYRSEFNGTSGVLQHAAASGTPVVATNVGQVGRIVSKWGLGKVVDPESPRSISKAVAEMIGTDTSEIRKKSKAYVEKHHWRTWANKIHESYLRVRNRK